MRYIEQLEKVRAQWSERRTEPLRAPTYSPSLTTLRATFSSPGGHAAVHTAATSPNKPLGTWKKMPVYASISRFNYNTDNAWSSVLSSRICRQLICAMCGNSPPNGLRACTQCRRYCCRMCSNIANTNSGGGSHIYSDSSSSSPRGGTPAEAPLSPTAGPTGTLAASASASFSSFFSAAPADVANGDAPQGNKMGSLAAFVTVPAAAPASPSFSLPRRFNAPAPPGTGSAGASSRPGSPSFPRSPDLERGLRSDLCVCDACCNRLHYSFCEDTSEL
jgi:hypothetical protein